MHGIIILCWYYHECECELFSYISYADETHSCLMLFLSLGLALKVTEHGISKPPCCRSRVSPIITNLFILPPLLKKNEQMHDAKLCHYAGLLSAPAHKEGLLQ